MLEGLLKQHMNRVPKEDKNIIEYETLLGDISVDYDYSTSEDSSNEEEIVTLHETIESLQYQNVVNLERLEKCIKLEDE